MDVVGIVDMRLPTMIARKREISFPRYARGHHGLIESIRTC